MLLGTRILQVKISLGNLSATPDKYNFYRFSLISKATHPVKRFFLFCRPVVRTWV